MKRTPQLGPIIAMRMIDGKLQIITQGPPREGLRCIVYHYHVG